jgi:hypothetical protein
MKAAVIGAIVGAGLLAVAWNGLLDDGRAYAQRVPSVESGAGAELITLAAPLGENRQQLIIIDPRMRVVGVYHIDAATGEIALKSVRNFQWDLQLTEFNSVSPLPREIRPLLEQN